MKKKKHENYLDNKPMRNPDLKWSEKDGIVTIEVENKGLFNKIAQKLLKKPKISYVHLDETGSFIWPLLDGNTTIADIGITVEKNFGDKCQPLYERLAQYCRILESYNFIIMK